MQVCRQCCRHCTCILLSHSYCSKISNCSPYQITFVLKCRSAEIVESFLMITNNFICTISLNVFTFLSFCLAFSPTVLKGAQKEKYIYTKVYQSVSKSLLY